MNNALKLHGTRKFNRNSYFKSIGTGKYQTLTGKSTLTNEEITAMLQNNIAEKEAYKKMAAVNKATETKSKVCVIANHLIKNGVNRSEAFRKAWQLVKAETIQTRVTGVTFGKRQKAIENLKKYDISNISISLEREADNEHDKNAIAVKATVKGKGAYIVGYINKNLAKLIAPLIDYKKQITATFQEIVGKYQNYHNYGLEISVNIAKGFI
jgi:hypothetical protein